MKKQEQVRINKNDIKKETEKAFLVKVGAMYKNSVAVLEVWIAKSRCAEKDGHIYAEAWMFRKSDQAMAFLRGIGASHKAHLLRFISYEAVR